MGRKAGKVREGDRRDRHKVLAVADHNRVHTLALEDLEDLEAPEDRILVPVDQGDHSLDQGGDPIRPGAVHTDLEHQEIGHTDSHMGGHHSPAPKAVDHLLLVVDRNSAVNRSSEVVGHRILGVEGGMTRLVGNIRRAADEEVRVER